MCSVGISQHIFIVPIHLIVTWLRCSVQYRVNSFPLSLTRVWQGIIEGCENTITLHLDTFVVFLSSVCFGKWKPYICFIDIISFWCEGFNLWCLVPVQFSYIAHCCHRHNLHDHLSYFQVILQQPYYKLRFNSVQLERYSSLMMQKHFQRNKTLEKQ